jgi:uncharacterized phage protein gp47/JayE
MTFPWGLTVYGFRAKTLEEIVDTIETRAKAEILDSEGRPLLNTKAGPVHQLIGIFASEARVVWEVVEAVHGATDPDRASGAALVSVGALTGSEKLGATNSTVTATVTLGAGVTLPAGSIASVDGDPDARFVTLDDVGGGAAGDYEVELVAETAGPVAANAGTLTEIETPVSGWTAITNELDAVQGSLEESDAEFRVRRDDELESQGTSPQDAIRADLLRLLAANEISTGSVTVAMNVTDFTNGDGLPPHSVEAIVYDGTDDGSALDDDAIAQVLWTTVAAGIATHGTSSGTAIDALGVDHTVEFSRPTPKPVYISTSINVAPSRGWDEDAGEDAVATAIAAFGDANHGVGDDVSRFRMLSSVFETLGVIDVTAFTLGFSASPVGTANLTIAARELATFDTSRIVVTPTVVTPP